MSSTFNDMCVAIDNLVARANSVLNADNSRADKGLAYASEDRGCPNMDHMKSAKDNITSDIEKGIAAIEKFKQPGTPYYEYQSVPQIMVTASDGWESVKAKVDTLVVDITHTTSVDTWKSAGADAYHGSIVIQSNAATELANQAAGAAQICLANKTMHESIYEAATLTIKEAMNQMVVPKQDINESNWRDATYMADTSMAYGLIDVLIDWLINFSKKESSAWGPMVDNFADTFNEFMDSPSQLITGGKWPDSTDPVAGLEKKNLADELVQMHLNEGTISSTADEYAKFDHNSNVHDDRDPSEKINEAYS